MLILSRKVGESIQIGEAVTVTITEVRRGRCEPRVRLGIAAPSNVSIVRTELLEGECDVAADADDE